MATVFTYKNLTLDSSEIVDIDFEKSLNINTTETISFTEMTQAGVLKANRISISTEIRNNTDSKFIQWHDLFNTIPTENLTLFNRSWSNYFFEKMNIKVETLAPDGTILYMKMNLGFVEAITFI
jgi:hypothetical protein